MKIGQFKYHPRFGVIEITGIDYDQSNTPMIISADHSSGSTRILLRFATNMRDASPTEITDFLDKKNIKQEPRFTERWYHIQEEVPEISNTLNDIVFTETSAFLTDHPTLDVKFFGADTNIFYSEFHLICSLKSWS